MSDNERKIGFRERVVNGALVLIPYEYGRPMGTIAEWSPMLKDSIERAVREAVAKERGTIANQCIARSMSYAAAAIDSESADVARRLLAAADEARQIAEWIDKRG